MYEASAWPPVYAIKKHQRAKRVKLTVSRQHGLQITVPQRFRMSEMPAILEEHKQWILDKLQYYQPFQPLILPDLIELSAIAQTWRVSYINCDVNVRLMRRPQQEIVLFGRVEDAAACKKMLMRWLKKMAQHYLLAQLKEVSAALQLPFTSAAIRGQQTRWGSCSANKVINLNYKLLFLPSSLMHHVLVHELCHTKHLNHSNTFWQLVAKYDAAWQVHRRALTKADQYVPLWAV